MSLSTLNEVYMLPQSSSPELAGGSCLLLPQFETFRYGYPSVEMHRTNLEVLYVFERLRLSLGIKKAVFNDVLCRNFDGWFNGQPETITSKQNVYVFTSCCRSHLNLSSCFSGCFEALIDYSTQQSSSANI